MEPLPEAMLRCLVIEDETETSGYICKGLAEAGHLAVPCYDGVTGLQRAVNESWNIVILDRLLPGGVDGLSILRQLRELGKTTPVLIVSAMTSIDERVRGLRGGGDDYITKPFAFSELLARMDALLRRSEISKQDATVLQVADLTLDMRTLRVSRGSRTIPLQPREFRLLEYLIRHEGQVVTRTMLFEAVWDYRFDPQTNVIDVQISRLRNKIDKDFTPALIQTIRGVGYSLRVDA
jgi:two-component system OmpR family response regulator